MSGRDFQRLIAEAAVPGIAIASIAGGRLSEFVCCGVRGVQSLAPVDEHTVFDAASLTKPVFAEIVLQLADRRALSLDAPLGEYLPDYVASDPRASSITARQVLSHSSGLPNWRNPDLPLKTYFAPGERFSYSGEGYLYLQRAIERVTGETIDRIAERLVFAPLGMTRSSLIWDRRFASNRAYPHDAFGRPALGNKPGEANAAWSLQTTAADFACFLCAVLDGEGLTAETAAARLQPQIVIDHAGTQCLGTLDERLTTGVAWGLGWGLEPAEGTFFHWGDNGPFTCFTVGSIRARNAVVAFTNGASGHSIMPALIGEFLPGDRPSLAWLDYVRHDAPVRRLLRAARARGIETVWSEPDYAGLETADLRWVAQGLVAAGREDDSAWLQARIKEREAAS
ncbi:MAG TPA: serine hydrolase domain-containing protein [Stellaceae bacterium]|nr:serine hydrolase domain-containing protein [Stellaceae bacterium]